MTYEFKPGGEFPKDYAPPSPTAIQKHAETTGHVAWIAGYHLGVRFGECLICGWSEKSPS